MRRTARAFYNSNLSALSAGFYTQRTAHFTPRFHARQCRTVYAVHESFSVNNTHAPAPTRQGTRVVEHDQGGSCATL